MKVLPGIKIPSLHMKVASLHAWSITCNTSRQGRNKQPFSRNSTSKSSSRSQFDSTKLTHNPHQTQPPPRKLPKIDLLVVVEGLNDMKAVRRAVDADIYVLGSATKAFTAATIDDLCNLSQKYPGIVLLLDPDVAGRQARNAINEALSGCWHAFIPTLAATSEIAVRYKKKGNIGVEHASPGSIVRALSSKRQSIPGKGAFTREKLQEMGLIATTAFPEKNTNTRGSTIGDSSAAVDGDGAISSSKPNPSPSPRPWSVSLTRHCVCEYLGLGTCDGKQLLRQLNSYGFEEGDVENALQWAEQRMQELQATERMADDFPEEQAGNG